jgi:ABC-type lipoprotein export system ATPase subunit
VENDALKQSIAISVKGISKSYKGGDQKIVALNNVSLEVGQGELIALTGDSGSGKTTLLQLIGGLDKPSTGEVIVDGVNINKLRDNKLSAFRNKTIGFVFQFFYLQPFLKLAKNIELPAMFAHRKREERSEKVEELLAQVNLSDRAGHYPKELSGGQMQRAAIARALLNDPKVLLADEPTGNLDSTNSKEIIDLFRQIRDERRTTIIIVTHNPDIAASADREIKLKDGMIV